MTAPRFCFIRRPAALAESTADFNAWFKENILVEQPFVKDDSRTVGQVLKSAGVEPTRFVRFKVGEIA